jgi:hypothetical protein
VEIILTNNRNGASTTAVAFVTYSLIPYLGILFCPGAVVMGMVGWLTSQRVPGNGGRQASFTCVLAGLFILGLQVFLWWLLYKIPAWSGINSAAGATGPTF